MDGWAIVGPGKPLKLKYFVVGAFRYAPIQDLKEQPVALPEPKPEEEIDWEVPEKQPARRRKPAKAEAQAADFQRPAA